MINLDFSVYATDFHINKALQRLSFTPVLSFDTETAGVYSKEERKEAEQLLKGDLTVEERQLALLVSANSGLSFPSLVNVTHFIFGTSESHSVILICDNPKTEYRIWKWVADYNGLLLIHNTLFDLKLMYNRIGKFPKNYEDTALLAKVLINNSDTWKSKVGLKELMADDYDPSWTFIDEYEPKNLKDPKFLKYAAIDGAATFKLWTDMQDTIRDRIST